MPQNVKYPEMTSNRTDQYPLAAEDLYNAMVGKGNNKEDLIKITRQFNAFEREKIAQEYQAKYGKALVSVFDEELSGNLRTFFKVVYSPYYDQWATWINDCIKAKKDNLDDLSELLFMLTKDDYEEVQKSYYKLFGKELAKDVVEDIKESEIAVLIKSFLESQNKYGADPEKLADYLYEKLDSTETEKRFVNMLCNCHAKVYREVCQKMEEKYSLNMDELIKKKFGGKQEFAFLDAHFSLKEHKNGVARQLYLTMKGMGTDEEGLIRVTELYADRMKGGLIKESYTEFGDVTKDIKSDLSGKDEDLVLALWGLE